MDLPVMPPVEPMLAKSVKGIPDPAKFEQGLSFEPKWDGFRCLVFRDGDEVVLASRNTKPLTRYFPEVVSALLANTPPRCVLDGEIVLAIGERLEFEKLQERIHPADSRVRMLAETTPAAYVAFDLLAIGDESLMKEPFAVRRARLESELAAAQAPVHVTPTTTDTALAEEWFHQFEGAGLDGVVAKPMAEPYSPNGRTMLKIKHERTADVVLAGYRLHKTSSPENPLLGSMLLGLYADGKLQHIGVSASFTAARRAQLMEELKELECPIEEHPWGEWAEWAIANPDRVPGTQSRWSAGKDLSFTPLRPERVLEVGYDHMEGRRFRHTAQFKRWRPDRDPESCGYEQLDEPVNYDLAKVLRP
ncbi:MAG TPA: ATP-dependent DNA ligase [Nocardioidaceae bacterium]|nr:ATP-dependent DNA ligase [Nocardioidaceae bacterium]